MPISIYNSINDDKIKYLSANIWDLPSQILALQEWLEKEGTKLEKGKYVADIGFDVRKDATGGGGIINSKMIAILAEIGMEIYLSEYPENE